MISSFNKEHSMKKYILLSIPIVYYRYSILYFDLETLINLTIVLICLFFLLRQISFSNLFDWVIAVGFTIYFCILFDKTIYFVGLIFLKDHQITVENLHVLFYTVNPIPFKSIIDELRNLPSTLYQLFGNVIMLVPLAFSMLHFKWVKSYKQAFWYSVLCTVGIELIQFLHNLYFVLFAIGMNRSTDIDDVILNTLGAVIGIGCYYVWSKIEIHFKNKQTSNFNMQKD
jgi:glycopeptide antibiotics resistance protein